MAQYYDSPGGAGDFIDTPHAADMNIVGNIAVAVRVAMDDWTPAADQQFIAKAQVASAVGFAWHFKIGTDGKLRFHFDHSGGQQFGLSSAATGFTDGTVHWVAAERDQSAGTVKYYTGDTLGTLSQLGTTQTSISTNDILTNAYNLRVGRSWTASLAGNLYEAHLYNGDLSGTLIADYNGDDFTVGDSDTDTAVGSQGNTWTLRGTGEIKSDVTAFNGTGTASIALTATAAGFVEYDATASAALALSTSADGFGVYEGQAAAALALTTSAAGNAEYDGEGTASLALTTSADGNYEPAEFNASATAALVLTVTGEGASDVPTFSREGSADLVLTARADGDYEANATGTAGLVLSTTATGVYVPAGFTGTGSASIVLTASADGAFDATWTGTGSASVELTVTATGVYEAAEYAGAGSANLVLTASAVGVEGAILLFHVQIVDGPVGPQIVDGAYGPQLVSVDLSNFGG